MVMVSMNCRMIGETEFAGLWVRFYFCERLLV
jgi:hypothetical protein